MLYQIFFKRKFVVKHFIFRLFKLCLNGYFKKKSESNQPSFRKIVNKLTLT